MSVSTQNAPKMHSVKQAADFLGLSVIRVRQFCQEGRLGMKVGNYYVIEDDELREFAGKERPHGRPAEKN